MVMIKSDWGERNRKEGRVGEGGGESFTPGSNYVNSKPGLLVYSPAINLL